MPQSPEVIARYRRRLTVHRVRTSALLVATWDRLGSWNEQDIVRYEERTEQQAEGSKAATVALAAGFLALWLDEPPAGVTPDLIDVTLDTTGPFRATWHALKMGRSPADALAVGRSTASASGFDFVQRVARRTGDHVAPDARWKRVPDADACDWCRMVARDDYRSAEAADFGHERDGCVVVPA